MPLFSFGERSIVIYQVGLLSGAAARLAFAYKWAFRPRPLRAGTKPMVGIYAVAIPGEYLDQLAWREWRLFSMLRSVYNGVSLTPYTDLVPKTVAFLGYPQKGRVHTTGGHRFPGPAATPCLSTPHGLRFGHLSPSRGELSGCSSDWIPSSRNISTWRNGIHMVSRGPNHRPGGDAGCSPSLVGPTFL